MTAHTISHTNFIMLQIMPIMLNCAFDANPFLRGPRRARRAGRGARVRAIDARRRARGRGGRAARVEHQRRAPT